VVEKNVACPLLGLTVSTANQGGTNELSPVLRTALARLAEPVPRWTFSSDRVKSFNDHRLPVRTARAS
jgi:hypothetical protein